MIRTTGRPMQRSPTTTQRLEKPTSPPSIGSLPTNRGIQMAREHDRPFLVFILLLVFVGCSDDTKSGAPAATANSPSSRDPAQRSPGDVPNLTALHFSDRTAASGVDFTFRDGQEAGLLSFLESVCGGPP